MAADPTLVSAAFKEAKSRAGAMVPDQSALYQSTISQSRQFLGAITGVMKDLDDKMEKNKLGTEQQLKGFDTIAKNNLRKLYAQKETLPNKIVFAIEEEVKRLQAEFEKVNTYGDKDTSENEKARVKLEASLQRVINQAIEAREGFMTISGNIENLNVDQMSRNTHTIAPMKTILDLDGVVSGVSMDNNDNISVAIVDGNLTYTTSGYNEDGSGEPVYMNMSQMQEYLPTNNDAHTIMLNDLQTAAVTSGKNGGIDGKYDRDANAYEIVNHGSISSLQDFQSAMDQKNKYHEDGLSFTRSLTSNADIPLSLIKHAFPNVTEDGEDVWSDMYWAARELDSEKYGGDGDGILEQSEIDAAKDSDDPYYYNMFMKDAEALIDVITNTKNKLFSESTSKELYSNWAADINENAHNVEIANNIAKAEKAEGKGKGKGKGKEGLNVVAGQTIATATWNKSYAPYIDFLNNPKEGQVMQSPKGYRVEYKNGDFYLGGEKVNSAQDAAEPDGLMNYVTATAAQEEDIMDTPIGQSGFTLKDYKKIGGEWFYVRGGKKQKVIASTTINQLEDALKKTEGTGGVDEEQI